MSSGYIVYRGPSLIDGSEIVAVATGFSGASSNHKLGAGLVQVWILRSDISPARPSILERTPRSAAHAYSEAPSKMAALRTGSAMSSPSKVRYGFGNITSGVGTAC